MKTGFIVCTSIFCLVSSATYASDPDFFINFLSCKNAVGYLVLSDESLKIIDGDPTTMGCVRHSSDISCDFVFNDGKEGHKGNSETYKVVIDAPPLLHFATSNGSEFIAFNTSQHAAVLVSRLLDKQFAGSKVCHGIYMTSFEMDNLEK